MVSYAQLVIRRLVIQVFLKIKILERLRIFGLVQIQVILNLFLFRSFFQRRVGFQFLLDPSLEFQRWHLQQLHQLNLLGRELLEELLLEALLEHSRN